MFTRTDFDAHTALDFHAPESSNALSLAAARALAQFKFDRPVVVRSRHARIFCAGGNLNDHSKFDAAAPGLASNVEIAAHLDHFAAQPVPKLAVIEGDAIGGGVEWLARFDARFITPSARLIFWQKRVGLAPGWGGGAWWARLIGEAPLRQLLLDARPLSAPEALRLNLVDRIVNEEAVDVEVNRWVREITSPINAEILGWRADTEAETFGKLWWGDAHRAALAAWRSR